MTDMPSFQYIAAAQRLFYGPESLNHLGRELDRLKCRRAMVVCGPWARGALLDLVQAALGERSAGVFEGVAAHSPLESVEAAASELMRLGADAAVALGGGSSIVTARAASILAAEGKVVRELCTTTGPNGELRSPKLLAPKVPQIVVPTTPTTAMLKAGSAVFDPDTGERLPLFDPKTRAHAVFIHPRFIESAPSQLVVTASLNTFAMAIEGLTSRTGNPLADAQLMHALRLAAEHLRQPARHADAMVRGELLLAAILCGQGTDHTAAGITTVLGHAIGARYGTENGVVNAIVLPHVLRFNAEAAAGGMKKVAAALGVPHGSQQTELDLTTHAVKSIFGTLDIPRGLRDLGVPREALADIAASAMGDWFLRGNPRPVTAATELQQILEQAW